VAVQNLVVEEVQKWKEQDPGFSTNILKGPLAKISQQHYSGGFQDPGQPNPFVTRSSTRGLFVTDLAGRLVASINSSVPYRHAHTTWWQGSFNNGLGQQFIENVSFDQHVEAYTFTFSLPIMDSLQYQAIGVLHRIYDAKEFFAPSIDIIRFGETGHVMLIDGKGTVISCPILPTGLSLASTELLPLVTHMNSGWVLAPSDGHGGESSSIIGFAPLPTASRITQASTEVGWHMFVWQSSGELFGPIRYLFTWLGVFGIISIGFLIVLGSIASSRIVNPIRQLQEAAVRIGQGEWQEPLELKTGDEIEELAEAVNRMNKQLEASFTGLTSEVEAKAQELEFLQETQTQILEGVPDPVVLLDQSIHIQYMNHASQQAFGLENGNGKGRSFYELVGGDEKNKQQLDREFQQFTTLIDNGNPPEERKQEEPQVILKDPLSQDNLTSNQEAQRILEIKDRVYEYQLFSVRQRTKEDNTIGMVLRDISEESRLQDQLIEKEKFASLGVLSAGIAHELNNPLVGVIGFGEAILDEKDPNQIKEFAQNIVERGRRMVSVIQDFTGQMRERSKDTQKPIDLNEQLALALKLGQLSDFLPDLSSITIQTDYQPLPQVLGNAEELRQVFLNVLKNALHSMKKSGTLTLSTQSSDGTIFIHIQDSGPGIAKNHLPKIFDPFFTTKRQGEGAGLGLTIVRRILGKYGGDIKVESELGTGTTCTITIPVNP
jgi:signal transduction histidine kinase